MRGHARFCFCVGARSAKKIYTKLSIDFAFVANVVVAGGEAALPPEQNQILQPSVFSPLHFSCSFSGISAGGDADPRCRRPGRDDEARGARPFGHQFSGPRAHFEKNSAKPYAKFQKLSTGCGNLKIIPEFLHQGRN